jgi:acyl-CoA reductase-like NAD-dependent aldehyde dehydrogenase
MIGNTIILKPASAAMQCGIEIEETFDKAGVPEGVFQTVVGDSSIAETLIDSDGINAISLQEAFLLELKLLKGLHPN